ncbi:restriction endonuclease subunit S [Streptomyces sp. NPDC091040]|uniref:restriction endonuclease subunit S n=1 Tax=Streptomyces sp. NPDC091040 TaxID=3365972 RepID=UPI00380828A8
MTNVDQWTHAAPPQWTRGRLKNLIASASNGTWGTEPGKDGSGVHCIRAADFDRTKRHARTDQAPLRNIDASSLRHHELQPGDLVLEKSGGGEKQPVGMAVLFKGPGRAVCSNFCARISPAHYVDSRFLTYVFAAAYSQGLTQAAIKQTTGIQNLDTGAFLSASWAYPELDEQRRIADFLDAETARIDRLAEARRHQSSLLNERFEASVFSAVSGQDELSPRTESGPTWLGSVPRDWPVMPVAYQFEVLLGKMLNQESAHGPHLRQYLRNTNVQWDRIETDDLLLMNFPPEERKRYTVSPGDLLVCEGGEPGRAAIWHGQVEEIYYQKALHRVRARGYSSPRWLYYCLRAATSLNVFAVEGNATTISHLTGEQLRAHRFAFPQRNTQDRLVARLDASARTHEQLKRLLQEQLVRLTERRQALITAAVTGQFDVSTASGRNVTDGMPTA